MNKAMIAGGGVALVLVVLVALASLTSNAGEVVLVRGIVLSRDGNVINTHYTLIAAAADKTKWQGLVCDVNVGNAKRYKWEVKGGSLTKVRTTSIPSPSKEVVIKGTIGSDCRITATEVTENYRQFTMTGTLEGIKLDTGSKDAGWLTVNISKSVMRNTTPAQKFKETQYKGKDILIRFDGTTDFTALGKSKQADEVKASQQTVIVEGDMNNEVLTASKVKEQ